MPYFTEASCAAMAAQRRLNDAQAALAYARRGGSDVEIRKCEREVVLAIDRVHSALRHEREAEYDSHRRRNYWRKVLTSR